jgi:hydroxymethylpyrimidine pyrophosphatase-like HAD family hydrolase
MASPSPTPAGHPGPSLHAEIAAHLPAGVARPRHDPAKVGLVALDIDGTLTNFDDEVSAPVRRAVHDLVAAGIHPVFATGRAVTGMLAAARNLELREGWAVCSNGAVIVRLDPEAPGGFRIAEMTTFDPSDALAAIGRALPGALVAVEDLGLGWRVTSHFPAGGLHGHCTVVPYEELVATPATRVVVRVTTITAEEMAAVVAAVDVPCVTYDIGWTAWLDMTAPDVTKASGLEVVRRGLDVPGEGTVAIGDGSNDIPMLRWASRAVAMEGSREPVVAAATEQCPPVGEDGVVSVIQSILAGRRSSGTRPGQEV